MTSDTPDMTRTAEPTDPRAGDPGPWQAMHIFYAANPQPLLLQCVRPLVAELEADGLLDRLLLHQLLAGGPARTAAPQARHREARTGGARRTEEADRRLPARPARRCTRSTPASSTSSTTRCSRSSSPAATAAEFMDDGRPDEPAPQQLRTAEPYEPEYGKYGGPAGIELAEWHFRHSSDLVIEALRHDEPAPAHGAAGHLGAADDGDVRLLPARRAGAGRLPGQLLRVLAPGLPRHRLHRDRRVRPQLRRRWRTELRRPLRRVSGRRSAPGDAPRRLPGFLRGWAEHCLELRERAASWPTRRRPRLPLLGRRAGRAGHGPGRRAAAPALPVHAHDEQPAARHHPRRGVSRPRPRPGRCADPAGRRRRRTDVRPARRAAYRRRCDRSADQPGSCSGAATVHLIKDPAQRRLVRGRGQGALPHLAAGRHAQPRGDRRRSTRGSSADGSAEPTGSSCWDCSAARGLLAGAPGEPPRTRPRETTDAGPTHRDRNTVCAAHCVWSPTPTRLRTGCTGRPGFLLRRPLVLVPLLALVLAMEAVVARRWANWPQGLRAVLAHPSACCRASPCSGSAPRCTNSPTGWCRPALRRTGRRDRPALAAARRSIMYCTVDNYLYLRSRRHQHRHRRRGRRR